MGYRKFSEDEELNRILNVRPELPYTSLEAPENVAIMSGRGPGMDLTQYEAPENTEIIKRSLAAKGLIPPSAPPSQPANTQSDYPYYRDDKALNEAKREASLRELVANVGGAFNKLTTGVPGDVRDNSFYEGLAKKSQEPVDAETDRQKMVREYLKDKYEGGIKKKSFEAQLEQAKAEQKYRDAMLSETMRKNRADEDIERGKLTSTALQKNQEKELEARKPLHEIETRKRVIEKNIDRLKEMIGGNEEKGIPALGTYETLGAHNSIIDATASDIATDLAKLKDPSSTARDSEVQAELANLVQSGIFQDDDTAIAKLDALKQRLGERVEEAYVVRGIKQPTPVTKAPMSEIPPPGATQRRKRPDGTWEYR